MSIDWERMRAESADFAKEWLAVLLADLPTMLGDYQLALVGDVPDVVLAFLGVPAAEWPEYRWSDEEEDESVPDETDTAGAECRRCMCVFPSDEMTSDASGLCIECADGGE